MPEAEDLSRVFGFRCVRLWGFWSQCARKKVHRVAVQDLGRQATSQMQGIPKSIVFNGQYAFIDQFWASI